MSRKITMPKCPYCGKEKEYRVGDYDTSRLVSMATGIVYVKNILSEDEKKDILKE